jgi:hypothetical protein
MFATRKAHSELFCVNEGEGFLVSCGVRCVIGASVYYYLPTYLPD